MTKKNGQGRTAAPPRAPEQAALLHKDAVGLIGLGRPAEAAETLARAVRLSPRDAALRNDFGIAQEKCGDFAAAESSYREAIRLAPALAQAHSNLADLLANKLERPGEAIKHAREALRLTPANPLSWQALGQALEMHGEHDEAIRAYEQATQLPPPQAKVFAALARAYAARGRGEQAIAVLDQAQSLCGDDPKILNDRGLVLGQLKRFEAAQQCFEAAYARLQEPTTLFNILTNLSLMNRPERVLELADEVLKHSQPNVALVPLFNQASLSCQWALQQRLLPHFMEWCAMEDGRQMAAAHALLRLLPIPGVAPSAIRDIAEKVAATGRHQIRHYQRAVDHAKAMEPRPKLRIGYLSADFRQHVVNYYISGLLSHYDKQHFEVYCYSNLDPAHEDAITEQYRKAVDRFIRVSEMSDEQLIAQIAGDGIQLLIELSGYTAGTRVGCMHRRPAPVQLTYLGYPFTTGMSEIDYSFSDPWQNGPENADCFVERILEIPHVYASSSALPVTRSRPEAPFVRNGYVTFGSLNNCYKLNPLTIATWARILHRVPQSRVILNHPNYASAVARESVLAEFEGNGIDRGRVEIISGRHPKGWHFYWYDDFDIALDSFPQTGGATTLEAIWMGVPVVTLVGTVQYQRSSYSQLKNCGTDIDDLVAFSLDEYVDRAAALALNPERLRELHALLPLNIRDSLLFDPARHVRYFEEALIEAWNGKFPDQPRFTPESFVYTKLESPASPIVATVSQPGDLHAYVVKEQGRWFAPEYQAIHRMANALGGTAVEIGSEPGFFSLEASQAGLRAICFSTSTVSGRLIASASRRNGVEDRVDVRLESPRTNLLDRAGLAGVTLLRIGVEANDGAAAAIARNPRFWQENSPVVLLSVHCGDRTDLSAAERLQAMNYRFYRYLPSLDFFVPHRLGEALDAYALYLLGCPPGHEPALAGAGLLVADASPVPASEAELLSAATLSDEPLRRMDEWIVRCAMLVSDPQRNAGERLAMLELALKTQATLVESAPSTTRRMTLARLLQDAGHRAESVSLLNQCLAEIQRQQASITEPFLAPSRNWEAPFSRERFAEWLVAALAETRCRLAAHSTFFLSPGDIESLEIVATLGFETAFSRAALDSNRARQAQASIS